MTEQPAIGLPTDLKDLLNLIRQLAALIEPLQMLLAMERQPGIAERVDAFLFEINSIGERIDRAATSMERALAVDAMVNELIKRQDRTERMVDEISRDLSNLLDLLFASPKAVEPT